MALKRTDFTSDELRITQVLLNLISNALKFTRKGGITVDIKEGRRGLIEFEVTDTGIGIAEEDLPRLFQFFGKLQDRAGLNVNGCGIGLHVSRKIVQKLGGDLRV